jgi:CheY-like chemotaxis protein/nitrogen-specific signal transduction histidine kinase
LDRGQVVERDASGNPVRALGIHADISEQRATQEALKLSAKRKDEFLATLAHELRNPLAPLRTGLEILKRNDLPPNTKRARDMMERQLLQMVRLIDDLLDVARITQGKLELKRAIINLQETVEAGIEGAMPLVDSAGHRLVVEMPEEAIQLSGDATRLAQVVSNLLSNAAKYTPQGGTIALRVFRTNGTATISVSDSGLGIPRDMLESIFDMFGQVNQTLDRSQGGLGIGLAIVRKIVEMHGGDVRAESAGIGKGSAFTVHIPVTKGSVMTDEKKSAPRSASEAEPRMILVVDDNVDGAESMALFINMAGHKAEVAHDGPQALAALEHGMPDIIFLDIGLPSMTGYEVAKKIRSLPGGEHVRLVALTGWGTEADKLKAQEAGFTEHLTKPVDLAHIEQILGTASTGLSPAAAASLMAASP